MEKDPNHFRNTIQHHSKSFAFASSLIPREVRHPVEVLYTWCRNADDAIDLAGAEDHPAALARLRAELDAIYSGTPSDDATVIAMQELVVKFQIPRTYPEELLEGMAMDARGTAYPDTETLLLYCFRVAGTVGLMMSHVLGVREPEALQNALHLGIAMQLTNICRDVKEDWANRRLYIPHRMLSRHGAGALPSLLGSELSVQYRPALTEAVDELLALANVYYESADVGMRSLGWREALSVRAARLIYSEIGSVIRNNDCDVFRGRVYVSRSRKYLLGLKALSCALLEMPYRTVNRFSRASLTRPLRFPNDVLLFDNEG